MLTNEQLAEIRERLDKATPGPWERDYGETKGHVKSTSARRAGTPTVIRYDVKTPSISLVEKIANGDFVAHAPTDIAALLTEVAALRKWRGEAVGLLESAQCSAEDGGCIACSVGVSSEECDPNCPLAALLAD